MPNRTLLITIVCVLFTTFAPAARVSAQGIQPYPNAVTDRLIHQETPLAPPLRNVVFTDPDFGSSMVRATDSWSDVDVNDSAPVCGSTHSYDGDTSIDQPFAGEIFCIETDGLASTIWRFAHNRATYIAPFFQTQPLGSISRDGHFILFTSNWDNQLGTGTDGKPLSDAFIVKLE